MRTPKTPVASVGLAAEPADVPAEAFAAEYSVRPVPAAGPVEIGRASCRERVL